jgi:uncharacterized protein GlcG (DUF336 family)
MNRMVDVLPIDVRGSLYNSRNPTTEERMSKLTLKQANTIIEKAFAKAREMKIKPLGVIVLDEAGNIKSAQREDGASMFRLDVARGKAWASVAMGASSRALLKRAKDNPSFYGALAVTAGGQFLPQTGAALIKDKDGTIIGAAGASGGTGDEDEACCVAGIEAAGLTADASA